MICVQKHHLVDKSKLAPYNTVGVAEMCGIELYGTNIIDCYTPDSARSPQLFDAMLQYHLEHPERPKIFVGDFNIHNPDWVCSTSKTDKAGQVAQEFCEMFGFNQLVDFPTREGNTLDLIMTCFQGTAAPLTGLGTSDHVSITFKIDAEVEIPIAPKATDSWDWMRAPWNHIRGAVKRSLKGWKAIDHGSVDHAQRDLEGRFVQVQSRFLRKED